MSEEFEQTVNLRSRMKKGPEGSAPRRVKRQAEEIDKIYDEGEGVETTKRKMKKISKPKPRRRVSEARSINPLFIALLILVFGMLMYVLFFSGGKKAEERSEEEIASDWYSVQLSNEEVYYAQIVDKSADPVVLKNVYYNYDQAENDSAKNETGSLRLVKRGKETHGPVGVMNIVRSQVMFMEPLKEESKVLKAILDYEKLN